MKRSNLSVWVLFVAACVASLGITLCHATESEVGSIYVVQWHVPDLAKLEVKAIDVLSARFGLTRAEAREKVRTGGLTDPQKCLDYIVKDLLLRVTQARATDIQLITEGNILKSDQLTEGSLHTNPVERPK